MPRPLNRVQLENGLKLDLNSLARRGFVRPGSFTGPVGIKWTNSYWGLIATGIITADMSSPGWGWFSIRISGQDHHFGLVAFPRHFGGHQWYFLCPVMKRPVTVLWMPPGARSFEIGRASCRERV